MIPVTFHTNGRPEGRELTPRPSLLCKSALSAERKRILEQLQIFLTALDLSEVRHVQDCQGCL